MEFLKEDIRMEAKLKTFLSKISKMLLRAPQKCTDFRNQPRNPVIVSNTIITPTAMQLKK